MSTWEGTVEAQVHTLESTSAAEVVVVVLPAAAGWGVLPALTGGLAGWLTLCALLWLPIDFHPSLFPLDTAVFAALGAWLGAKQRGLLLPLLPRATRQRAVHAAAAAAFLEERVHALPSRTGLLVLLSEAERCGVILPDIGLSLPADALAPLAGTLTDRSQLVTVLQRLQPLLTAHAPLTGPKAAGLSDGVRVRR